MSGVDGRIVAAIEMLRSMQADGFSVPLLVELAVGMSAHTDRAVMLAQYREQSATPDAIHVLRVPGSVRSAAGAARRSNEATFANFVSRWPDPLGQVRDLTSAAWRALDAADQAEAINRIDAWMALRRMGGFTGAGPALLYLHDRSWRRTPDHFDPQPTLGRSS